MMQIQQGMQRLTNAAPGLLPGMGINPMGGTARPPPAPGNMPNNAYNMQHLMSQVSLVKACLISTGSYAKSHIFYRNHVNIQKWLVVAVTQLIECSRQL